MNKPSGTELSSRELSMRKLSRRKLITGGIAAAAGVAGLDVAARLAQKY